MLTLSPLDGTIIALKDFFNYRTAFSIICLATHFIQNLMEYLWKWQHDLIGNPLGNLLVVCLSNPTSDTGQRIGVSTERNGFTDSILKVL